MKALVTFMAAVALVFLAMVVGVTPVAADSPPAAATNDTLLISVEVDKAGGWTAFIGEDQTGISSTDFGMLMSRLGFDIPVPVLDASMVKVAEDGGVQSLALVKEGENTTVLVNGAPVSAVRITDSAISKVTNEFMPELEGLVAWLNSTNITLVAYFPSAPGTDPYVKAAIDSRMPTAPVDAIPANVVELAATLSPDGELLSVGGVPADQLGLPATQVDLSWLEPLGIEDVSLSLDSYGASVSADGEEWLGIAWDMDALLGSAPDISRAVGFEMAPEDESAVALAADWLKDTKLTVGAYVSDTAQEAAPVLQVGRAVQMGVHGSNLVVEGFDTGFALDAQTLAYVESLGSANVVWDGPNHQLRTLIGGKPMPVIVADEGFVSTVGAATMGDGFLPWQTLEQLLGNTSLAAEFVYPGTIPPAVVIADYRTAYQEPAAPVTVDLLVSRKDGRVAAWGEPVPLDMIDPWLSQSVLYYVEQSDPGLQSLSLDVGPSGVSLGVNDSHVRLVWDAALRDNALDLLLDIGGKELNLPPVATTGLVRTGLQYLLGAANQLEFGVHVQLTDDTIPEGAIESLARGVLFY